MSLARVRLGVGSAVLAASLAACGEPSPVVPLVVAEGDYRMEQWSVGDAQRTGEAVRGHPVTNGRTLTFDRTTGRVTVRYVRDGRAVVETWRATRQ
jgi:hypothetical protein